MALYVENIGDYEHIPRNILKGLTLETKTGLAIIVLEVDEKYSETARPDGSGIVSSTGTVSYREIGTGDTKIVSLSDFVSLLGILRFGEALELGTQRVTEISEAKAIAILDMIKK